MSDTTSKDDELGIDIFTSDEWLVEQGIEAIIKLCTQPIISNNPNRKARVESAVRKVFEAHGRQERIDEVELLRAKQYTAPDPIKPRSQKIRAVSVFDIDKRLAELTALKTKQEVAN